MKEICLLYPEKLGTIAPELYGHFTEHIGGVIYDGIWVGPDSAVPNIRGFRRELVEKLRAISPAVIRWPGGCFAEAYRWQDGIGADRPTRPSWWTTRNAGRTESNAVGTHEFADFCELVGAKPYFAVGVTSTTPMDARDWMDYCLSPRGSTTLACLREKNGHPEPFEIPYWGIGNENWGEGGNMSAESYAMEYRRFATVMENLVRDDPRYDFFAGGPDAKQYHWTRGLLGNLSASTAKLNGMSFHYYYYCKDAKSTISFTPEEWDAAIKRGSLIEELICRHYAIAQGYCMEGKARLVIDEWGCWYPDDETGPAKGYNLYEQQSTMRDAVYAAMTLNIFNNHCDKIRMANIAQLCNNIQSLFLAGGEHCITTPTYHVFDLFKTHQGGQAIRTLVEDNAEPTDRVSVSASEKNGVLTVTLANCSCHREQSVSLSLLGADWQGKANGRLLACEDLHAHNRFDAPDTVSPHADTWDLTRPIHLPRGSVLSLEIPLQTNIKKS